MRLGTFFMAMLLAGFLTVECNAQQWGFTRADQYGNSSWDQRYRPRESSYDRGYGYRPQPWSYDYDYRPTYRQPSLWYQPSQLYYSPYTGQYYQSGGYLFYS